MAWPPRRLKGARHFATSDRTWSRRGSFIARLERSPRPSRCRCLANRPLRRRSPRACTSARGRPRPSASRCRRCRTGGTGTGANGHHNRFGSGSGGPERRRGVELQLGAAETRRPTWGAPEWGMRMDPASGGVPFYGQAYPSGQDAAWTHASPHSVKQSRHCASTVELQQVACDCAAASHRACASSCGRPEAAPDEPLVPVESSESSPQPSTSANSTIAAILMSVSTCEAAAAGPLEP